MRGDGSIVETDTGNFTYRNPYGRYWVYDPKNLFNSARVQVSSTASTLAFSSSHRTAVLDSCSQRDLDLG
jgi:hypothetical protein